MADHRIYKHDGFLPTGDENDDTKTLYKIELKETDEIINQQNLYLVLLLDFSYSMYELMDQLKEATISTIELAIHKQMLTINNIILVPFGSEAKIKCNFKNINEIKKEVYELKDMGGTNYERPLKILFDKMKTAEKDQFVAVMFSDGEPQGQYQHVLNEVKKLAANQSLIFHSIALGDNIGEDKLRELTTIGTQEGYYQHVNDAELETSMTVLVDNFKGYREVYVDKKRTYNGLFVYNKDVNESIIEYQEIEIPISSFNVVNESFNEMIQKKSYSKIFGILEFILENYIRNENHFEHVINIIKYSLMLLEQLKTVISEESKLLTEESREKMRNKLSKLAGGDTKGVALLQLKSDIVSVYNKEFHETVKKCAEYVVLIHGFKELCARIQDNIHKDLHNNEVNDTVFTVIRQYRDATIANNRKHMARFSSKIREQNMGFADVDKMLDEAVKQITQLEDTNINTPEFFKDYTDPITLNDFQEILLYKYGVFMLLLEVNRSDYGIVAPHRTKILKIGGINASVLDVMMQKERKSNIVFDFRGVGFGNAAVPLWISKEHWKKGRAVFNAFVAHAVTGNELEYTKLQGETLLALILLYLQTQPESEYNTNIFRMVKETLCARQILDREKWLKVLEGVSNNPECLKEENIPSIEVFFTLLDVIGNDGTTMTDEKAFILVAEEFRRRNNKRITKKYEELRSKRVKSLTLKLNYPTIFEKYCKFSPSEAVGNRKNMPRYFTKMFGDQNQTNALEEFNKFANSIVCPTLKSHCFRMTNKQKIAVVLSTHKCTIFDSAAMENLPANLSFDEQYPEMLFAYCTSVSRKTIEKHQCSAEKEKMLIEILSAADIKHAETLLASIPRNSPTWATLLRVLFRASSINRQAKITNEMWNQNRTESYCEQLKNMDIPLHFQLIMYTIYDSLNSENWLPEKMVWKPDLIRRRRIKTMFPDTNLVAGLEEISKKKKRMDNKKKKRLEEEELEFEGTFDEQNDSVDSESDDEMNSTK